jgi:hypothetical protein
MSEREQRRAPRQRAYKGGRVVFNNGHSTIDCLVRNISSHGALLTLPSTVGIPDEFEVWMNGKQAPARVTWKRADKLGVAWV